MGNPTNLKPWPFPGPYFGYNRRSKLLWVKINWSPRRTPYNDHSADIDVLDGWNYGEGLLHISHPLRMCAWVIMRMIGQLYRNKKKNIFVKRMILD